MNSVKPHDRRPVKKLIGAAVFSFAIRTEEGLAIHGSDSGLEIGSVVLPNLRIITDVRTGLPYVPGSSLKGKLRSTLEKILGEYDADGKPHSCRNPTCLVCVIFGAGKPTKEVLPSSPTRIVVRDAHLTEEGSAVWQQAIDDQKPTLELKTESSSNRATGTAVNPRTGERVPPGTEFGGEIVFRIFQGDSQEVFIGTIRKLLFYIAESDGLGSGVSRGSGKISVRELGVKDVPAPVFP